MKHGEFTFTMIKPTAVKLGKVVPILHEIDLAGFSVIAMKMTRLSRAQAERFYLVHKDVITSYSIHYTKLYEKIYQF